jgi:tetratricopeptide (TPR) repeat protein
MTLKEQLLQILEKSRARELEFLANLSDQEKAIEGTFENWSAKDVLAHTNYWEDVRSTRSEAWIQGEGLEPIPPFNQANVKCFERFSDQTWEEVEAFAKRTHERMVEVVRKMDEDTLTGPSEESQERKMWDVLVGSIYTHKILHYAEYYEGQGRQEEAGELWNEWVELVSPLDDGPEWQGNVRYNAACSLALAGDEQGALEKLRQALELRPSLKAWSRLDSDLELLHDKPEYREMFAPDYWWQALEANPQAEALADQFMRSLFMLRIAVGRLSEEAWRRGETNYQRPAGLALHIAQTLDLYSELEPGKRTEERLASLNWQETDSSKLPSQQELLAYLDNVEERLARFLAEADLQTQEKMYPWTGVTLLSRALYSLRHAQHHLADLAMELQHRGLKPPGWQ